MWLAVVTIEDVCVCACYRITQNNPKLIHYVEFDRIATDVNVQSDSNIIDCRKCSKRKEEAKNNFKSYPF